LKKASSAESKTATRRPPFKLWCGQEDSNLHPG
jgi:hypothetical protein